MAFTYSPLWPILLAIDLGVCLAAFAGAWALGRRPGARLPESIAGGAIGVGFWLLVSASVGGIVGFGLAARVLWTSATVALPVFLLWEARALRLPWLVLPAALLAAFKWHGEVREPGRLEITRATVPVAGLRAPVKVAHFSDLQTDGLRPHALEARDAANAFDPDFATFSGDVMNHASLSAEVFTYLAGFKARRGKLFAGGDADRRLDRAAFEEGTGFMWIDGRAPTFSAGGTKVAFLGFALLDYRLGATHAERLVRAARGAPVKLALAHRPDTAFALAGLGVPVLFTGHTHGGQVVMPFLGPMVTLSRVPREVAAGGVSSFKGMTVILSRGLGLEGHVAPRVRLFCRPQLLLVTLVPARDTLLAPE